MPEPVERHAPAKVNLTLAVLGGRGDGFHDLHSVMVPLAFGDRLVVAIEGAVDSLEVDGLDPGPNEDNLALRAVAAARAALGDPSRTPPLALRLDKRIPVAAGLAGGSSDAAAALAAALEAWGVDLDPATRQLVAASLGSDVPFFLAGGPALVEGRGERVTPLRPGIVGSPPGILLVTPAVRSSTPAVFAAFDLAGAATPASAAATRATSVHLAEELARDHGLRGADLVDRAGVLSTANDLLAASAVLVPRLAALRTALRRRLGRPVGLSGSGPTLWALYPSETDAAVAATVLREAVATGGLEAPGAEAPTIIATSIGGAE